MRAMEAPGSAEAFRPPPTRLISVICTDASPHLPFPVPLEPSAAAASQGARAGGDALLSDEALLLGLDEPALQEMADLLASVDLSHLCVRVVGLFCVLALGGGRVRAPLRRRRRRRVAAN